jgi:hypothetical protein
MGKPQTFVGRLVVAIVIQDRVVLVLGQERQFQTALVLQRLGHLQGLGK